jgi:ABC-type transport system involved in cytochrome bd biosynthesis fused ATPase/permease subunit
MRPTKQRVLIEEVVGGGIAIAMMLLFLGFMAVDIGAVPLIVITLVILAMILVEFVESVREAKKQSDDAQNNGR